MKITKQQLKQLIREELAVFEETLDLGALAGGAEDDNHLMLLETAARYEAIAKVKPGWAAGYGSTIKRIHAMFRRVSLRLKLEK